MFLQYGSSELSNHLIHSNWHLTSDHVPLSVTITIAEENIDLHKRTIKKNSKEEELFIKEVIASLKNSDISNVSDISNFTKYAKIW